MIMTELLVDKYRPKIFNELIGNEAIIQQLAENAKKEDMQDVLLVGPAGCGKTSAALVIAKEYLSKFYDESWKNYLIEFNASDERGIDVVRGKIKKYSKTAGKFILFLDEYDAMTKDAQNALRRTMENSQNAVFILCVNYEHKVIDPIASRCGIFNFEKLKDKDVLNALISICKKEKIDIANKDAQQGLIHLVKYVRGDLRKAINQLESVLNNDNQISIASIERFKIPSDIKQALTTALDGDIKEAKKLLEDGILKTNPTIIIEEIYSWLLDLEQEQMQVLLMNKFSEFEGRIKMDSSAYFQFMSFLGYVWIAPHLKIGIE
jgi:replication factor C small subunit